ncbi:MAG: ABC transporter permease [Anaerolineae bacterium]|nr:ABC transporter permease [Anaerolineae bacterium]
MTQIALSPETPTNAPQLSEEHDNIEHTKVEVASQWQLMWWKFKRHRMAVIGGIVVLIYYIVALFANFFAPVHFSTYNDQYVYAPPQQIRLFRDGKFNPYVYGYRFERDPVSFKKIWALDEETIIPVSFFTRGEPYKLWGLIPGNLHLFGPKEEDAPFYLLGADKTGRDVLSRIIFSSQVSLTVGLVGVAISLILGILIGGISGLVGGVLDNAIQRLIEILISIPTLPLWLALAAVVPLDWTPLQVYFMITVILSLIGWTGLGRVVRSKFLALREEDFILAATLDGVPQGRMIMRHMLPSFLSHIIAQVTLSIPYMILGETALSFLGLGLRPPVVSWGVMLQETQKVAVLASYPWLLYPAVAVIIVVLALNFLGDGLRDAADPY